MHLLGRLTSTAVVSLLSLGVLGLAAPAGASVDTSTPDAFVPSSTSWTSPDRGWVLGYASCDAGSCARLVTTSTGGESWELRTAPPLELPRTDAQVRIVFAPPASTSAAATGYATDGKRVYVTTDGAETWERVRLAGTDRRHGIGDVVATARRVYALVGDGKADDGRTRLLAADIGSTRWTAVDGVEIGTNGIPANGGWDLVTDGRAVAVSLGEIFTDVGYWFSSNGRTFAAAEPPCTAEQVTDLGAVRGGGAAALCSYDPGMGFMFKDLKSSPDGGDWQDDGSAPNAGITQQYASPAPGQHVVSAISDASVLYRSTASGWDEALVRAGAPPFTDLAFVDRRHGYVVLGGPHAGAGEVYRSADAGRTWTVLELP